MYGQATPQTPDRTIVLCGDVGRGFESTLTALLISFMALALPVPRSFFIELQLACEAARCSSF